MAHRLISGRSPEEAKAALLAAGPEILKLGDPDDAERDEGSVALVGWEFAYAVRSAS